MSNLLAVSVIIPLYNAEKYIGECLESLLNQTFQNFEVVIVDDCSADSSCAIVESYIPKFNGRIKLFGTEKNSGSGAIPRNIGLKFSRGEYVFNMDNDDLLTLTALEEMYALAKDFDADVVYTERYARVRSDLSEFCIYSEQKGDLVDRATFVTKDLSERVHEILNGRFWVTPWSKFVRRKLLLENEIFFPPCRIADDDIWTYELIFCAEKFLRVPNVVYIWRQSEESLSHRSKNPLEELKFWLSPLVYAFKPFDDFLGKIEFFRQNPHHRLVILDHLANGRCFAQIENCCLQVFPDDVHETIKQTFAEDFGEQNVLFAYLCTLINDQRKNLQLQNLQIRKLKNM